MLKAMEDQKIFYDGTVRNANKNIIQFAYGDDSMDPTKLEKDPIKLFNMDNKELSERYQFKPDEDWKLLVNAKVRKEIVQNKSFYDIMEKEYHRIYEYREILRTKIFNKKISTSKMMSLVSTLVPFNMNRIINNTRNSLLRKETYSDLNPVFVINKLERFFDDIELVIGKDNMIKREINQNNKLLYKIIINTYLSPKRVIKEYKLNSHMYQHILTILKSKIIMSMVQPGEMVGPVSAQSLGESTTQMNLNTFHHAGITGSGLTTGVPRLKEIIQASKNPKEPIIQIYLNEEYRHNLEKAEIIKNNLRQTTLKDIIKSSKIIYDPNDENSIYNEDNEFIQTYHMFMADQKCSTNSPWLLRLELDKWSMLERGIIMLDIQEKLYDKFGTSLECIFSDDNSNNLVVRIRINPMDDDNENEDEDIIFLLKSIDKTIQENINLRGISGINNAIIPPLEEWPCMPVYDNTGNFKKVQYDKNRKVIEKPDPMPNQII